MLPDIMRTLANVIMTPHIAGSLKIENFRAFDLDFGDGAADRGR